MKKVLIAMILFASVIAIGWKLNGFVHKSPVVILHEISRITSLPPFLAAEPNSKDRIVTKEAFEATTGYLLAHRNCYPVASHWEQAIQPFWNKNVPFSVALTGCRRLAMNSNLSGKPLSRLDTNGNTILFYETTSVSQNANGIPPHVPLYQKSGKIPDIVCVDGHSINE